MKNNNQKGFIVPLIIGIVAVLIIAGGVYVAYERGKPAQLMDVGNNGFLPGASTTTSSTSNNSSQSTSTSTQPAPVITSINPSSGPIGTIIELKGNNLAGFESDLNVWIENSHGVKGILYSEPGSTSKLMNVVLKSQACQTDESYRGLPCASYLNLTPGTYKIYTYPWGNMSNTVQFIVTASNSSVTSTAWKTYTNSQYGYTLQYPSDFALVSNMTSAQKSLTSSYMGSCHELNPSYITYTPNEISICYVGSQTTDGFSVSAFNISVSSTTSMSDCQKTRQNNNGQLTTKQTVISGITFYEDAFGDAGLGHYVSMDSFRTYQAGTCYTINLNVESHVGNVPHWSGLDPSFVAMMNGKLKSILSTFKFINSSTSQPSITILSPNGGDVWKMGQTYTISYTVNGNVGPMTIKLDRYSDDGTLIQSIDIGTSDTNSFIYKVPLTLEDTKGVAGRYKIEIYPATGRELVKRSDYFSIIR